MIPSKFGQFVLWNVHDRPVTNGGGFTCASTERWSCELTIAEKTTNARTRNEEEEDIAFQKLSLTAYHWVIHMFIYRRTA